MAKTVDDLRNEIRVAVGRFERQVSTDFTKESLAAICDTVGDPVDAARLPPKSDMRSTIAAHVPEVETDRDDSRPFRKSELHAIADHLAEA
ncbi:hypothetical protein [Halorhabdus rudnickae]|uniref:hypothetical protein n=1 Tax=Halorhabdus rudnickae TaxID=1775544 RepID=UPI001082C794|nr:hypothetical protein [Halorhabdus rudnickae]